MHDHTITSRERVCERCGRYGADVRNAHTDLWCEPGAFGCFLCASCAAAEIPGRRTLVSVGGGPFAQSRDVGGDQRGGIA